MNRSPDISILCNESFKEQPFFSEKIDIHYFLQQALRFTGKGAVGLFDAIIQIKYVYLIECDKNNISSVTAYKSAYS